MPADVPEPDASEEIHLSIFAETVLAVMGQIEEPWPRPYPYPYPYPDPDEVVIPPPRPAANPAPPSPPSPPVPEEQVPQRPVLRRVDLSDDGAAPALAMLARGRHELFG